MKGERFATLGCVRLAILLATALPLPAAAAVLKITSPSNGAVIHSGTTLSVTVEGRDLASPQVVVLGVDGTFLRLNEMVSEGPGPVYKFEISIPPDVESRTYTLVAEAANHVESAGVVIDIERPDQPKTVKDTLECLTLEIGETRSRSRPITRTWPPTWQLYITGTFADGKEVQLTRSKRTSYSSEPGAVASVTKEGLVTALRSGRATITVKHGDAVATVNVTVSSKKK
jgi:hypothetical protein